ncbi:flavin reductase family protein [Pseudonocardia sp. C8]|uniref:flavin reductase family protein n=1 Tax=Pseudonocardia sp. C8 TaxID=2762759 RepID=UPI001642EDB0|nr:flavin reductase family protein [Pseudonocardia sp. C8]MBC3190389.1 flavin reductase family protein [Pseudonocardia sp. C8]
MTIDQATFRTVMGHLPTGVVAIAGISALAPHPQGLVVGTFQSLSLTPPMVAFSVDRSSSSWPKVRTAGRLGASVLAAGQEPVCQALSRKQPNKFADVAWHLSEYRTPRIAGAHAWIDCAITHELDGGDHVIVLAEVLHMEAGEGDPLVFHRGRLGSYREPVAA